MPSKHDNLCILGVRVSTLTIPELQARIHEYIVLDHKAVVLNVNAHCLTLAHRLPWLREFLNQAALVFCDGSGVMLAARILQSRIPQRITYADWMWQLAEFAEPRDFTFFFLGAHPGVADRAAAQLRERFPNLRIVGIHHGYFDKASSSDDSEAVIQQINTHKPNILVVGFGMPLQERWLMENWDRIEANIFLTGGAVFDYVSGELRRAPRWMTEHGLEWLGRLIIEPARLWKRYIVGNPLFLYLVLKQRLGLPRPD